MISAIPDLAEHREQWRRIINGALRTRYPDGEYRLERGDAFDCPELDPAVALAAVFARGNPAVDLRDPISWDRRTSYLQVIAHAVCEVIRAKRADVESADPGPFPAPDGD